MKIAVAGAGNWGKNLLRTFHELGALGAIAEADTSRHASLAQQYPSIPILADILQVKALGITAVALATPVSTHYKVAKACLEAGLDVFVEKPLTLGSKEATELVQLAETHRKILMVGHLLLYQPAIRWISSFLKEDGLGKLLSLHQERLNLGRARSVENALWSLGVHDVAVVLTLVGENPNRVSAVGQKALATGVEDDVYLHLEFPGGVRAHLHTSWLWPEKSRKVTLIGSTGMLVFDELKQTVTLHRKTISPDLQHHDNGVEMVFQHSEEPLRLELEHFLARLHDREKPLSDGQNGLAVVKVLEKASKLLEAQ